MILKRMRLLQLLNFIHTIPISSFLVDQRGRQIMDIQLGKAVHEDVYTWGKS